MSQASDRIEEIRKGAAQNCDSDFEYIVFALCEVATQLARANDLLKAGLELDHSPELVREFLGDK